MILHHSTVKAGWFNLVVEIAFRASVADRNLNMYKLRYTVCA